MWDYKVNMNFFKIPNLMHIFNHNIYPKIYILVTLLHEKLKINISTVVNQFLGFFIHIESVLSVDYRQLHTEME